MTTTQLILLLVLVLVVAVVVVLVLRRASAKRDEHRVEAAGIRGEAEAMAATVSGQAAFAQQAQERAEVARVEAEERAREAARLEAEAAEQRASAEATRREYEAAMRRADDIDPDVKESSFAPVPAQGATSDAGAEPATVGSPGAPTASSASDEDGDATSDDGLPMTRAERRQAREEAEGTAPASDGPGAVAAGAATAGAVGASTWATRDDDDASPESRRIASAADFRDEVPSGTTAGDAATGGGDTGATTTPDAGDDTAVSPAAVVGTGSAMSHDHATEVADAAADDRSREHDLSRDAESPRGEWGGPPADTEAADLAIVSDTDAYASDEPLPLDEQTPPVERDVAPGAAADEATERGTADAARDDTAVDDDTAAVEHATAETGAAVVEPDSAEEDASASDRAAEPVEERYDPTPTRDWAADEGELLADTHDRGDRLAQEREELDAQAEGLGAARAVGDDTASGEDVTDQPVGRRVSEFHELRDGGFGVGSAAPLEDGAQPLDHPVQAYRDTMTFRAPGDAGYDTATPDVWFYDEAAAERSGFRRSEG